MTELANPVEVLWEFELESDADAKAVARELQARLAALSDVEEAQVEAGESRFVAETLIVVATGITVLRAGRELTEELTRLIHAVRELIQETKGLKHAVIDVEGEQVSVLEADPGAIAAEVSKP